MEKAVLSRHLSHEERAEFVEGVKRRCTRLGLTRDAAAARCKMTAQRFYAILKEDGRPIRVRTAVRIAIALGIGVREDWKAAFWWESGAVIGPRLPVCGHNLAESNLNLAYHLEATGLIPGRRVEECADKMSRYYRQNVLALLSGLFLDLYGLDWRELPVEPVSKICKTWNVSYEDLVRFEERSYRPWTAEDLERFASVSKTYVEQSRSVRNAKR